MANAIRSTPLKTVLETKAGPLVRDPQLLVRTRNFLHISLHINAWNSQNSDQDQQLFQLSPEHWLKLWTKNFVHMMKYIFLNYLA